MNNSNLLKIVLSLLLLFTFLLCACGNTQEESKIELITENDKISYAIGFNFATQVKQSFEQSDLDINTDIFLSAISDLFMDSPLQMTEQEIMTTLTNFQSEMMAKQQAMLTDNLVAAKSFLEENSKNPGVQSLASGVQYEVIKEGTGAIPKATDTVSVNYRGILLDGTEFDSSYGGGAPRPFQVNRIIPGWTEVLQLMKTGSQWKVYIPPELAYGENPPNPAIPPNALLIFEIDLVEIME